MLHPADFTQLSEFEQLVCEASMLEPIEFSDEATLAHAEGGMPGEPVNDPAVLAELFG